MEASSNIQGSFLAGHKSMADQGHRDRPMQLLWDKTSPQYSHFVNSVKGSYQVKRDALRSNHKEIGGIRHTQENIVFLNKSTKLQQNSNEQWNRAPANIRLRIDMPGRVSLEPASGKTTLDRLPSPIIRKTPSSFRSISNPTKIILKNPITSPIYPSMIPTGQTSPQARKREFQEYQQGYDQRVHAKDNDRPDLDGRMAKRISLHPGGMQSHPITLSARAGSAVKDLDGLFGSSRLCDEPKNSLATYDHQAVTGHRTEVQLGCGKKICISSYTISEDLSGDRGDLILSRISERKRDGNYKLRIESSYIGHQNLRHRGETYHPQSREQSMIYDKLRRTSISSKILHQKPVEITFDTEVDTFMKTIQAKSHVTQLSQQSSNATQGSGATGSVQDGMGVSQKRKIDIEEDEYIPAYVVLLGLQRIVRKWFIYETSVALTFSSQGRPAQRRNVVRLPLRHENCHAIDIDQLLMTLKTAR